MRTGVAYFGCHDLDHVRADLRSLREFADYLVIPMSEADLHWSHGTIARIVRAVQDAGMEAWLDPWGVAGIFGGESLSRFLMRQQTEWQINSLGDRVPVACFRSPALLAELERWIARAAETGADGIFWDEPHFWQGEWIGRLDAWACRCPRCTDAFRDTFFVDPPSAMDDRVRRWQAREVATLVTRLTRSAAEHGLRNSLCLVPESIDPAAWTEIAADPTIESFGTDPYWFDRPDPEAYVAQWTRQLIDTTKTSGNANAHLWLQAFRVPAGRETEIRDMAEYGAALGIRDIAVWCYGGGNRMSSLASDCPDVVWDVVRETFMDLRTRFAEPGQQQLRTADKQD